MTLEEARARIGNKVVYRAPHARRSEQGEEGVITSVSDHYVFVRYGTNTTSAATLPADLEAIAP
jgi:hypothetical protein